MLQEGVRVRRLQQGAMLPPSSFSKGVTELLGKLLWRVRHRELFLQGTTPQLHLQLKLRNCFSTVERVKTRFSFIKEDKH